MGIALIGIGLLVSCVGVSVLAGEEIGNYMQNENFREDFTVFTA